MAPARLLASIVLVAALAAPTTAAAAVLPVVREKVAEEFPGALFPAAEKSMCAPAEHSFFGPTSYCFAEFTTGEAWNMVEVAVPALPLPGSEVSIYGHTSWERRWSRCRLHLRGVLLSNEDCGRGQPEQPNVETDADLFRLEAWPRIKARRPLRSVTRAFIYSGVARGLAVYRVSRAGGAYTFTNALGDSFRYLPPRGGGGEAGG